MAYIVSHGTYPVNNAIYRLFDIYILSIRDVCRNLIKYAKYITLKYTYRDNLRTFAEYDENITLKYRFRQYGQYRTECPDMSNYVQFAQYGQYTPISHIGQYPVHIMRYKFGQYFVHIFRQFSANIKDLYIPNMTHMDGVPNPKINLLNEFLLSHINISNRNRK